MKKQYGHSYKLLNFGVFTEELALIHKNYLSGLFVFTLLCSITAYLVYHDTERLSSLAWFAVVLVISVICCVQFIFFRETSPQKTQHEANVLTLKATLHGLVIAYSVIEFFPLVSVQTLSLLIIILVGMTSASVLILSLYPPMFIGFVFPSAIALLLSKQYGQNAELWWLSYCILAYIICMTVVMLHTKKTVSNSIKLQFENRSLIHELRQALTQTDDANRAKSIFLASASHDLRQPLHALGLLIETFGRSKLSEQQAELYGHMMSSVESTRGMLDSLLNISKLDAGAISADPKPFFIQTIFNKLETEIAPTADEQGLIYRSRDTIAAANSDALIVELIIRNLIANAIRYTDTGGLLIACRNKKPNKLVIEVWDTGIGIEKSEIKNIFKPFQQLSNAERDPVKGFGLGLSISQGLAKTIDANLTVRSTPGKGSVFRFELNKSNAKVIEDHSNDSQVIQFKNKSILIIDDDVRVRASMQTLMKSWDCQCIVSESAAQAVEAIQGIHIDIMLVDYRLRDGLTGRNAIDDVRHAIGHKVPAIIITGDTAAERIKEAQAVDAMLMHKPASTRQLQRMMNSLLS